ncbi:hypothetical protein D9M71_653460 [compost metagenome]
MPLRVTSMLLSDRLSTRTKAESAGATASYRSALPSAATPWLLTSNKALAVSRCLSERFMSISLKVSEMLGLAGTAQ